MVINNCDLVTAIRFVPMGVTTPCMEGQGLETLICVSAHGVSILLLKVHVGSVVGLIESGNGLGAGRFN